jgi:hypothetical protein
MTKKNAAKKKLRVIMLADESLLPEGDLKDYREPRTISLFLAASAG